MDRTTAPPDVLSDAALFYASIGWPVLPVFGKQPIGDLVPHAHEDASLDSATITAWWRARPDANIGVALDTAGLIDIAPDSLVWWAEFTSAGLPPTWHFASGGGRWHEHWLYRRGDLPAARIARSGEFDILSDGYAVVPPSVHASGNAYRWLEWVEPSGIPLWLPERMQGYLAERTVVDDDEVVPADTDEPPIELDTEQLAKWNGQVEANDRSSGLVEITIMLSRAGYQDVEGIASILAERDASLGWFKYTNRQVGDRSRAYRDIAKRYGKKPLQAHISGVSSRPSYSPREEEETSRARAQAPEGPNPTLQNWTWAGEEPEGETDDQVWYITGLVAPKVVTLVTAQTKAGKTTWIVNGLVRALEEGSEFCGQAVNGPLKVAYLTEERKNVFRQVLNRSGHEWEAGHHDLRYRSREDIPRSESFEQTIDGAVEMCLAEGIQVLVVDTLDKLARVFGDDENKAGVARKVMDPLVRAADKGLAVIVLRHEGVEVRDVSIAGRGSSQYAGDADILVSIRKLKGKEFKNHREVESSGRFGSTTPDSMLIELVDEKRYVLVGGTVSEVKLTLPNEAIWTWLSEPQGDQPAAVDLESGRDRSQIKAGVHKGDTTVNRALEALMDEGRVEVGIRPGSAAQVYWAVLLLTPPVSPHARARTRAAPEGPEIFEDVSSSSRGLKGEEETLVELPKKREQSPAVKEKAAAAKAAKELARLDAADLAAPTLKYTYVADNQGLIDIIATMDTTCLSLDTETAGLRAHRDRLRTVQFSDGKTHVVADGWTITDWMPLQSVLNAAGRVWMHTYLFDLAFLEQIGVEIDARKIVDVKTQAVVLESKELRTDFGLQGIAKRHLSQYVDKAEQRKGWDTLELRHAKKAYAAEDARVTWDAGQALETVLQADVDHARLSDCLQLEQDVQLPIWWLASAGAPADREVMQTAIREQEAVVVARLAALNDEAGRSDLNWNSPTHQVLPFLNERGLDPQTKQGQASSSADALVRLEADDPVIALLMGYRSAIADLRLVKTAMTTIEDDGRIYAAFNPTGPQTGRTSCKEPNLQNLPRHTLARSAIRPGPGKVFVRADYSQLQIVIAAWISKDAEMARVLNDPRGKPYNDIHQRTADAVGCTRDEAKAVNFGFLFGAGAETFRAEQRKNGVNMTLHQAFRYREQYMRTYRGLRDWHRGLGEWGDQVTIFDPSQSGRRRLFVGSNNAKANTPVQMVEAHGFKRALIDLYAHRDEAPSARLVMMVHDELIAEVDQEHAEACKRWLVKYMTDAMQPIVDGLRVLVEATIVTDYSDEAKARAKH